MVFERLGHRTIALTMDAYTHVMPALDRDAADRFGELMAPRSPPGGAAGTKKV